MQTLAHEFNPRFSTPEYPFIKAFDVAANGYDLSCGPACGKKWTDPGKSSQEFVPVEQVSATLLHPNLWPDADTDDDDWYESEHPTDDKTAIEDKYTRMADKYGVGYDDNVIPLVPRIKQKPPVPEEMLPFHAGLRKTAQQRSGGLSKVDMRAYCESHGKHGKKRTFRIAHICFF